MANRLGDVVMIKNWRLGYGIAAIVAIQLAILAWMIESRASILRSGAEITLKVEGFDPRDLLRGDYVQLAFPAMFIPYQRVQELVKDVKGRNNSIYVMIPMVEDENGLWRVANAEEEKNTSNIFVYLSGSFASFYLNGNQGSIPISLGAERYYVAEGTGHVIEDTLRDQNTIASVSFRVSMAGKAQIKSLNLPDGSRMEEPLY